MPDFIVNARADPRGTAERGPEKVERGRRWGRRKLGLAARRGHGKTRRGQKVQRGQNFKFNFVTMLNFSPRSACAYAAHIQTKIFILIEFKIFNK